MEQSNTVCASDPVIIHMFPSAPYLFGLFVCLFLFIALWLQVDSPNTKDELRCMELKHQNILREVG